jgi:hypothetical protein
MLRIEVDMFSGRPNPVWISTDSDLAKELIGTLGEAPQLMAKPHDGFTGLGFREVTVEVLADEGSRKRGIPARFSLASVGAEDFRGSAKLARRLIETFPLDSPVRLLEHDLTPLDKKMRELVFERFDLFERKPPIRWKPPRTRPSSNPRIDITQDGKCRQCEYEISQFNPAFWNDSTQRQNNCYNYGRNWKTNTFAQPGRAHGAQTGVMSCPTVTAAAMADGLVKRCNPCLPASEFPRRLMALVIDPGSDYHWYRHQRGGFWGHKPGQTAARNTDNSNAVITNPETCDRGGYTDFCGYFYAGKSVVIN